MRVTKDPISTWAQVFGPVGAKLRTGEAAITNGCFVHCTHGANRTGTVLMLYRHDHGWTKESAESEANALGWGTSFPALKSYWRKVKP
jgi:protein-tyrosine phosphatase